MTKTTKTVQNIQDRVIAEVAGEDVLQLVSSLKNKTNVSEFKLAESVSLEINTVRNMLYRLYDVNLVTFTRKKDKKKGWYVYYWTFNPKQIRFVEANLRKKKYEMLRDRMIREQSSQFYLCESRCIRLDFEQATDFSYKCPECGSLLHIDNNEQKIQDIERQMRELERTIRV